MARFKQLPYGISDFKQIRREGLYFVDKTMFLPVMENTDHFLFLIRPRRFGKSIFLSMMRAYYDINERDNFESLFGDLWISDHPTEERGKYQVLYLDFSRIGGDINVLEQNFNDYLNVVIDEFARLYSPYYPDGFLEKVVKADNFRVKLNYIHVVAQSCDNLLYLIVDEYDNFTNTVLNEEGESVYHTMTHANGFYRDVFKMFKGMFARILMMGVSPVTMDDVTSGYNIASNISMRQEFNTMLGFSEDDVRQMIRYYKNEKVLNNDEDELIEEIKPWYDNYCFARRSLDTDPKMFNCDMVLYFLNRVMQTGASPEEMIDANTRTDYAKMRRLIQIDTLDNYRRGIIHHITEKGYIVASLQESFPAETLMNRENFISLLYYYGMLTIGDVVGARLKLIIPNNNVRLQYYDWLMGEYQNIVKVDTLSLTDTFDKAAFMGDWRPMLEMIASAYRDTTSVRQLIEGERNLQGFMNAYLTLCPYYLVAPEMELNHGYCDFFLMPDHYRYPMVKHSYILELKYLSVNASEKEAEKQWHEAEEQIRHYAKGQMVEKMRRGTQLHLLIMQIRGYEMIKMGDVKQ